MVLAGAYHEHRGPLRASLRAEYGIDLRDPGMDLSDLSDLVANLPPGCALWRATGGPASLPVEVHALLAVKHGLDVVSWQMTTVMRGRPRSRMPEPYADPPYAAEVEAQKRKADGKRDRFLNRKAARAAD